MRKQESNLHILDYEPSELTTTLFRILSFFSSFVKKRTKILQIIQVIQVIQVIQIYKHKIIQ